jgi:DNA adenine methylase
MDPGLSSGVFLLEVNAMVAFATPKLRPAVKWHGGKSYLARRFLPLLPDHRVYCEPFAGGLNLLLNKSAAPVEIAGDLDSGLVGLYRALKDRPEEFLTRVGRVAYTRANFAWSIEPGDGDPLEDAVRFLVRRRFSRGGHGKDFAWSERLRGGQPGDKNGWDTIRRELPGIVARLAHVELRCQDGIELIRETDGPGVLFYLDPPYLHETRTDRDAYGHEMSDDDHALLIDVIVRCRGAVAISGYHSPLYDRALSRWERAEWKMPNHSGQGREKNPRTEVLWIRK